MRGPTFGEYANGCLRDLAFYVASLLELADANATDRRGLWRQAMAALSRAPSHGGPGALEGLHPDVLLKAVQMALGSGLVDDLDWLSPQAAGIALYTLASAIPVGAEQRELGRRVLARMLAGNADAFTAIATVMAQTGGKGMSSPAIRARVALVTELPLALGIADGPLALALVSRREHAREWVANPSTRSLPARRLTAKIFERAAREAARRAQMGDPDALRVFLFDAVSAAYRRMLADREPLVWRYLAVARGLQAAWVPELEAQIHANLAEGLSPTEWRRGAASLAALGAVKPEQALKTTLALVKRGFFTREDPASASAFVWGIARTIEAEPEAAAKMLDAVVGAAPLEAAEAVVELRFEYGNSEVVERAAKKVLTRIGREDVSPMADDGGDEALLQEIVRDLANEPRDEPSLRQRVAVALDAFVSDGAHIAYSLARRALEAAKTATSTLESVAKDDDDEGQAGSHARRVSMVVLRDVDASLLERHVVSDLLKLGGSGDQVRSAEELFDTIRERLASWIVLCENPAEIAAANGQPSHAKLRLRRLRALLHLVDSDLGDTGEAGRRQSEPDVTEDGPGRRSLWLRMVKALLEHFDHDPSPVLKRTLLAALARAFDTLVQLGVLDVADALLPLAQRIRATEEFETLAEASMGPDLRSALSSYARFLRQCDEASSSKKVDSLFPPPSTKLLLASTEGRLAALEAFANDLAPDATARSEALRTVLVRLHAALSTVAKTGSLRALACADPADPDAIGAVESWIFTLSQMCARARGLLDSEPQTMSMPSPNPKPVSAAVAHVLAGEGVELTPETISMALNELLAGVPSAIARLTADVLSVLSSLPLERPSHDSAVMAVGDTLPAWLPARRTIGGFYVVKPLGVGGTASVFVVHRVEDRHDPSAERFALKVPDYNATAARSVSQEEFFKLFREEASALLTLPNHGNLARFVTFDLAARPLPILVMELVDGVSLQRVLETKTFDMAKCLKVLDDVLAGLEAMHHAGLGHLDVNPANVLLRKGTEAVLVDFGLSGRKIRQGCGTGPYGSPEVWGISPDGFVPTPMAADIYSFGCLAFEMLTRTVLFDAPNEVAQIGMHVSHDGVPSAMSALLSNREVAPLANLLVGALRHDPRHRPTAAQLRKDIQKVGKDVADAKWPIALEG